jgi:hypothetical protein
MRAGVFLGHGDEAPLFLRGDHLGGIAESAIGLGLHFHKYYRALVLGNEVDLAKAGTEAPLEYLIPKTLQLDPRQILAKETQLLSLEGHGDGEAKAVPKVP